MGFSEFKSIETPTKDAARVTAALVKRSDKAKLWLSISDAVATEFGLNGDDPVTMDCLIGDGSDHGCFRFRLNKTGDVQARPILTHGTRHWRLTLGHVDRFVNRAEKSQVCSYEFLDGDDSGWLEIILPAWTDVTRDSGPRVQVTATPPEVIAAQKEKAREDAERREADERRAKMELQSQRKELNRQSNENIGSSS